MTFLTPPYRWKVGDVTIIWDSGYSTTQVGQTELNDITVNSPQLGTLQYSHLVSDSAV